MWVPQPSQASSDILMHYGVPGMKWGVRKDRNRTTTNNLKRAKTRHLSRFGKDANHNVLYITGASGSGKSTAALKLAKKNDSVIHIDTLLEQEAHGSAHRNLDFERYCASKGINVPKARDTSISKKRAVESNRCNCRSSRTVWQGML